MRLHGAMLRTYQTQGTARATVDLPPASAIRATTRSALSRLDA
jgi:hypothetical protein